MSNTLVFDYAVSIEEAQTASKVDYSFLNKCLVLVNGKFGGTPTKVAKKQVLKTVKKETKQLGKTVVREFTDPTQFKVVPVYDSSSFEAYTDNAHVSFFMAGGLNTVYLLMLATQVDPEDDVAVDFDPTDYFTLCFSEDYALDDAIKIDFENFSGIKAYSASDKSKAEELSQTDTVFYDDKGSYSGCYEQFGRFLSQVYWRNNQYYVLDSANPASTVSTVGEADDLFNKRISFYLNGSDGPTLGFFGNAGHAITKAYLNRLIRLETQEAITSYIQTNEPNDTAVQRVNIEEAAMAIISKYEHYPYFYLDSDKDNYINIVKSSDMYYVDGEAEVKVADPIWRAQISVREAQ
ncbi:hypothetical protein HUO09_05455 [Vibrio sp. Y2-5]|uniref:hypothetical protein n=1 Tax=Vibrio sp. Y2-5 TaxID=2743977 RepID=UPI001660A4A9|nr:hypothetical protein [Vibrio sp. Y2-5]MBD0785778.1 hypothetical protein [Vibrio sp. Y2-5]